MNTILNNTELLRIAKDAAGLRLAAVATHPYFKKHNRTATYFENAYTDSFTKAYAKGTIDYLYHKKKLLGVLLIFPSKLAQTGAPVTQICIDLLLHSTKARTWMKSALKTRKLELARGEINLMLMEAYSQLIPFLTRQKLHIESVILIGKPKPAFAALTKHYGKLQLQELKVKPVRTAAQIRSAILLLKEEFKRNPQFGWFAADPKFLAKERKILRSAAKSRNRTHFVIENQGEVIAYFNTELTLAHPVWGRVGGMSFCINQNYQGKGLLKNCYAILLKNLILLKADVFMGGTSQPPVLKIARLMKRLRFAFIFRNGPGHFKAKHFIRF